MNVEIGKRGHAVSFLGIFFSNCRYSAFAVCSTLIHSKINSLAPFLFSTFLSMIYYMVVLHSLNICIKLQTLNMHESRTWLHDQNIEVPSKDIYLQFLLDSG
jgi:hypothetical protein